MSNPYYDTAIQALGIYDTSASTNQIEDVATVIESLVVAAENAAHLKGYQEAYQEIWQRVVD